MAETRIIGAVAVKVRPELGGFRKKTKAGILRQLKDLDAKVEVEVEVDLNKFRRQLGQLEREAKDSKVHLGVEIDGLKKAFNKLRREVERNSDAVIGLTATIDEKSKKRVGDQVDDLIDDNSGKKIKLETVAQTASTAAGLKWLERDRFVNIFARVNKRSVAVAEGVLQSLTGWGVLSSAGRGVESLITNFDTFAIKAGAWGTALGGLADSLSYVLTSTLGVADGLINILGLTATAPALLSALAATVAINVAAWQDFGDAVNGDAKALAKLPPNAQAAAKSLQGAWTAIQKPVQKRFWDGMGTELADLAKVIIPQFAKGLADSAEGVGQFGAGVARSLKKISLNGDLKKMFSGLDGFFENLAKGAEPLIDALNTLGLRGSEYLPRFGTWLADAAKKFDKFITAADKAGDINRWIEDGVKGLQDLGRVGLGAKDIFMGLVEAAEMATGGDGLSRFADTLQRIGTMMRSEPFRSRMAEIFLGANEGASALNEGVKQLGRTLGESSGFVSNLLSGLGELGGNILKNVSRAIAQTDFQSGLLDAVKGLNDGVKTLEPTFENLGKLIGSLGSIGGDVFQNVAPLLNDLSTILVKVVQKVGPGLTDLAGTVSGTFGGALKVVGPLIEGAATGLGLLLDGFNSLPGPIKDVATALGLIASLKFTGVFSSITTGMTKMRESFRQTGGVVTTAQATLGREVVMMQRHLDSVNATGISRTFQQIPLGAKRAVAGAKNAFSGLSGALGGPWGIAIGALVGVIASVGAESAKQAAHVDELAESLDGLKASADTAKIIGEAFTGEKWNVAKSAGTTADAATRLGVSLSDLQDAALGSDDAMSRINDQLSGGLSWAGKVVKDARDTERGLKQIEVAGQQVNATYEGTSPFAGWLAGFMQSDSDRVINSIEAQRDAMQEAREKAVQLAEMKGIDASWALEYSDAVDKIGDSASNSLDRLDALMRASKIQAGIGVDLGDYEQKFNDTARSVTSRLNEMRNELKETGKTLDISKYLNKDGTIDTASAIGSSLRDMMKSFGTDGVTNATLLADSLDKPADKVKDFKKRMEELRESFNKKFDLELNEKQFNEVLKNLGIDPVEIETNLNEGKLKGEVDKATGQAKGEVKVDIKTNAENALGEIRILKGEMEKVSFHQYLASIGIDSTQFDTEVLDALAQLMGFDVMSVSPTINADDAGFQYTKDGVTEALRVLEETNANSTLSATDNASPTIQGANSTLAEFMPKAITVTASFLAVNYADLKSQWDSIVQKAVTVTASFASKGYEAIKSMYDSIVSKTVNIVTKWFGGDSSNGMNGGITGSSMFSLAKGLPNSRALRAFANGGIENHVAQISRSTPSAPIRIWSEPETGGEAYIPLAPSKRQRSLAIWQETGRRLGAFANGDVIGGGSAASSYAPVIQVQANDTAAVVQEVMGRMRFEMKKKGIDIG